MSSSERQPNIVLVLADNLGWGELGCYGGGALRGAPTPRIDSLADEGLKSRVSEAVRDVTKLRGEVHLVAPGSLANDGKVIEDARSYQ